MEARYRRDRLQRSGDAREDEDMDPRTDIPRNLVPMLSSKLYAGP